MRLSVLAVEFRMPKFLEEKLKRRYGPRSPIVWKIMNKLGFMPQSVSTPGRAREHEVLLGDPEVLVTLAT
jgi:hypothetical protein